MSQQLWEDAAAGGCLFRPQWFEKLSKRTCMSSQSLLHVLGWSTQRLFSKVQVLKSVWDIGSWCWPGSVSASRGWLRQFLLLKLMTALLFPHGAGLLMLVCCLFSLQALLLLRSPHISTKPSTVLLGQLALTDSLVLLHWGLRLGAVLVCWLQLGHEVEMSLVTEGNSVQWIEVVSVLCQQLLDAHLLATLLMLGLLGLEATLVSRWPQQTRRFRTSHWAQLSCSLIWILVLLELALLLNSKLLQNNRLQIYSSTLQSSQSSPLGPVPPPSMPGCFQQREAQSL
ncbi:hypothetical protein PAMP_023416 [Pampus punctatissimus]